jgi:hypothetical protein
MKLYDSWAVRASEAVAKTYAFETPKYWYDLFKGQKVKRWFIIQWWFKSV